MIPKINSILYATDLSKNSAYAFRYAINSAVHHQADVHILHVLGIRLFPVSPPAEEGTGTLYEGPLYLEKMKKFDAEQKRLAKEKIQKRLEQFCQQELKDKPECRERVASIQVVEGDPAGEILAKADQLKVDMVIMGTHGKGLLAHAFLGSVAEKVLSRIKIPVFIIPIPEKTDISFSDD
jgi:nucleotide-binding universal stress UspA family protein